MNNTTNKTGIRKIHDGTELLIEGWKILGLDRQNPKQFQILEKNLKKLKGGLNGR